MAQVRSAIAVEKLVYPFWLDGTASSPACALHAALTAIPAVHQYQLNLPDAAFCGGQQSLHQLLPRFDGALNIWLHSRRARAPVEAALAEHVAGFHGYAVCESTPMQADLPAADPEGRINVLSQLCLLHRPAPMPLQQWLSIWIDSHTEIAMRTQGTIAYVQNIVQTAVTADAPPVDAIVEECYPAAAYHDLQLFFGAPGDAVRMQTNIQTLLASTARFIEDGGVDRIFTAPHVAPGNISSDDGENRDSSSTAAEVRA